MSSSFLPSCKNILVPLKGKGGAPSLESKTVQVDSCLRPKPVRFFAKKIKRSDNTGAGEKEQA